MLKGTLTKVDLNRNTNHMDKNLKTIVLQGHPGNLNLQTYTTLHFRVAEGEGDEASLGSKRSI